MKKLLIIFLLVSFCTPENTATTEESYDDVSLWCFVALDKIAKPYENPKIYPMTEMSANLSKEFNDAADIYKNKNGIDAFLVFEKHWNLDKNDFNKFGKQIGIAPFSQEVIDQPGDLHITYYFHQFLTLENNPVSLEICDIWYSRTSYKKFSSYVTDLEY